MFQQEVVLIPAQADDEMDCDMEYKSGYKHKTDVDDGNLTNSADQQLRLFSELRQIEGVSRLQGIQCSFAGCSGPVRGLSRTCARGVPSKVCLCGSTSYGVESSCSMLFLDGSGNKHARRACLCPEPFKNNMESRFREKSKRTSTLLNEVPWHLTSQQRSAIFPNLVFSITVTCDRFDSLSKSRSLTSTGQRRASSKVVDQISAFLSES
jgi:hypothetical protein